jgi:hypothetical protein
VSKGSLVDTFLLRLELLRVAYQRKSDKHSLARKDSKYLSWYLKKRVSPMRLVLNKPEKTESASSHQQDDTTNASEQRNRHCSEDGQINPYSFDSKKYKLHIENNDDNNKSTDYDRDSVKVYKDNPSGRESIIINSKNTSSFFRNHNTGARGDKNPVNNE